MTIEEVITVLNEIRDKQGHDEGFKVVVSVPGGRVDIVDLKYDRNYEEVVIKLRGKE